MSEDGISTACDTVLKAVLLGAARCGKTALTQGITGDYVPTIGVEFTQRVVRAQSGRLVKWQLWDCGGDDRFQKITASYLRGAEALVFVYDASDADSLWWIEQRAPEYLGQATTATATALVGTKSDLPCAVSTADLDRVAALLGADCVRATLSAKASEGPAPDIVTSCASDKSASHATAEFIRDVLVPLASTTHVLEATARKPPVPATMLRPTSGRRGFGPISKPKCLQQ